MKNLFEFISREMAKLLIYKGYIIDVKRKNNKTIYVVDLDEEINGIKADDVCNAYKNLSCNLDDNKEVNSDYLNENINYSDFLKAGLILNKMIKEAINKDRKLIKYKKLKKELEELEKELN